MMSVFPCDMLNVRPWGRLSFQNQTNMLILTPIPELELINMELVFFFWNMFGWNWNLLTS